MRLLLRLLGGIWLATLVVTAGFTYLEVFEERDRLIRDLGRRASLAADAVREASEPIMARQTRTGLDRVLKRFGRGDRGIAIYDEFGSVIDATPEVKAQLAPLSPLISEAMRTRTPAREFRKLGRHSYLVQVVPLERDDKVLGAAAVLLDSHVLETQ